MINVLNRQRKIALDEKYIHTIAQKIVEIIGYNDFDLGILITTNKTIRPV